jgi:uncharacterized repeat protein (TIGR01451 family)
MEFKMRRLKLFSTGTVLLILFLSTFLTSGASAAGPTLNLPTFPVTATYDLSNPWPVHLTLSGVGTGYDVQDNVSYNVWCVEQATQYPSQSGVPFNGLRLYSSYDPNLPTNLKMYGTRVIPWDQINWILNNKGSYSGDTIQNAIWSIVEGQDNGSGDPNVPILVNAAMTNGTGFNPGPGQIIAVIVTLPPDGISISSDNWQENIIEVPVPQPEPGISIVKYTNGQLANDPNGSDVPEIKPGDPVTWTYVVTNTGQVSIPLANVSITDDQPGVTPVFDHEQTGNANTIFDPGEVWVYVAHGVAVDLSTPPAGVTVVQQACIHNESEPARTAYVNQGTATIPGATSTAQSSYCNPLVPGISIVKYTNGQLANDPNGSDVPEIKPGDTVTWTYIVTNTGQVSIPMANVNVTDNQPGVTPAFDHEQTGNTDTIFDPGEVWVYVATGVAVDLSSPPTGVTVVPGVCTYNQTQPARTAYVNQGTATIPGATSSAKSSYCNPPEPGISIVKYTNGQLANDPNGSDVPEIKPGDPVTWTYVVTNTGNVPVPAANLSITDDQTGVTPVFDHVKIGNADTVFDPGEVWVYVAHGVAVDLSTPPTGVTVVPGVCTHDQTEPARTAYVNQGTATIPGATSTAKSSYCNPLVPGISIVKYTNGQLANDPNGSDVPEIKPGDTVTWTYVVTNTGNVSIPAANISITDNQPGVTPVFDHVKTGNADTIFDPGEVWVYVASGIAVNLSSPPTGVTVVPGVCTHKQTQPSRTAYVNQGTATIPGATSSAKSSYCNPLFKVYLPLGFGRTVVNPTFDVTVGFEDLPLGGGANDFDYNDWVVDIFGETNYSNNGLQEIGFNFNPRARGAAYDHTFHLAIPKGTFGSNGTAVLTIYDKNYQVISSQTSTFVASVDNDYVIFPKTSEVFPNLSNTYELQPYIPPNRYASLYITFNNAAPFDLSNYSSSSPHGGDLFFDPYLHVINTGDTIQRGDIRMLTVPTGSFKWPEEQVRIDYAYPKVTFVPGNPPTITFPTNWWLTFNHCVYGDGIPCVLPTAPDRVVASPSAPVVTPGTPTVTPP